MTRERWMAVCFAAGTLCFNVTTYRAMHTAPSGSEYNRLVWRPDALGSIFLISGAIANLQVGPRTAPAQA